MPRGRLGTKREIRPGVWEVRVSCGFRADGSQRTKSRTVHGTGADADAALMRLADEMGRASGVGGNVTLDAYFWGRFVPGRERTTTRANVKTYESVYRCHIAPDFGGRDITTLDNIEIQRWVDGLPPQSAPVYVRALRAILSQASFDHVIDRSPMEGYRFRMPRGRDSAPLPVWGAREVAAALGSPGFAESRVYALWLVMVGAGLSRSEALAQEWEGIGWVDSPDGRCMAVVTVEGAVTQVDGRKGPKNDRRYRRVPVPPVFSERLRAVEGEGPICQSLHNGRPTGRCITPTYVPKLWRRLFDEGQPLHGLPFVPLNRMRATYSTLAQAADLQSTLINAMQGRSDGSEVLYRHYLNPEMGTFVDAAMRINCKVEGANTGLYGMTT